jgi:hypothetical protein
MADDLKALRDEFTHDEAEWSPIRAEGAIDMRYAAGDPWDPEDRRRRLKANRPCVNADEIGQYINQVVNEVRANKRAVKFTPNGNGATDESAKFYADKMREIEYRSRAQIGYTTAFENCVQRSFGFVRVNKRYASPESVHMDLWIDPVPNPNLITPGCETLMPDLSDMTTCWVREAYSLEEYNAKWKKHKIAKITGDLISSAFGWFRDDKRVFVGEHWTITTEPRTLLIVQPFDGGEPTGIFEDEIPKSQPLPGQVLKTRKVDYPRVVQQITNGVEVLEENEWEGKYIPIVGCLGKIIYINESGEMKRQILSMVRLARDPQMMLAFIATAQAETIGSLTKFPYFSYEGQLSQASKNLIAQSVHEPVALVEVRPTVEGVQAGTVLPLPQRNPWVLDLSQLELGKESFRRATQSSMGQSPLPTAAQRRNEKSGVALKHIEEMGQRGSFHFTDHYLDMITQTGVIIEDLMDKAAYDATRSTGIRKDDDQAEIVRINDPNDPKSISTKGHHLVTVSTGPSFESERDAANDFAGNLIESQTLTMMPPPMAMKVIAKAIKLKDLGPIGDQIAEIISPEPSKDGQPTPEQLQQQLEQLHGQMQQMGQALQEAQQAVQTKQIEAQGKVQVATIQEAHETARNEADNETRIAVAVMGNKVETLTNMMQLFFEERARLGVQEHEAALAGADAGHEAGMAGLEHAHGLVSAEQAAALAPPPSTNGAGA